jgi:hypothetical protein
MRTRLPSFHRGITARGASSTDAARRQSRHHAGSPRYGTAGFVFVPGRCRCAGQRRKEWRGEAAKDTNDAHDDAERGDTMTKYGEGPGAMLSIGETATLVQAGMHELRTLLSRTKRREKQRT